MPAGDLKGHESRVLYTALSPDGKTVCPTPSPPSGVRPPPGPAPQVVSAAGDETIRFWKVFDQEPKASAKRDREEMASSLRGINLR